MRNIFFILLSTSLSIGVFAQIDISAGIQAEGGLSCWTYRYVSDQEDYPEMTLTDTLSGFGAFVDATYVRISLTYTMSLDVPFTDKAIINQDTQFSPYNYSWTFLNLGLLGKYPISLGSIVIWPAAGLLYHMTLSKDWDGDGETDDLIDTKFDDLYVSLGCGADISVTKNLYVTLSILYHLNLSPLLPDFELFLEETFIRYVISGYIGVGWKF
ncbi:MAG: hypothetical protein JXJ04_06210 [Spirochaetales bacterium]|nr:hypothetical protein [Spirochaetales bacterium]